MRSVISAVLAIGLAASPVLAAGNDSALAPGKPAGVKQADLASPVFLAAGGVLALVGVMVLVLSDSKQNGQPTTITVVSTTTTTG